LTTETITVNTAPTEDLDAGLRAEVIRVCFAAHNKEEFLQLFSHIPSGGRHFLGYRQGELVSHAVVTTRWMQPEGYPLLKTAYVDAVSTHPDHEGKGFGSAVMRSLAEGIEGDYEIGGLETDRASFYERLGWEVWRGPLAGRSEDGVVPTPDQTGVMVLRLFRTPSLDVNSALTIECQENRIW
jgi:aminoglycoside 2'-N-acetyltransferase I